MFVFCEKSKAKQIRTKSKKGKLIYFSSARWRVPYTAVRNFRYCMLELTWIILAPIVTVLVRAAAVMPVGWGMLQAQRHWGNLKALALIHCIPVLWYRKPTSFRLLVFVYNFSFSRCASCDCTEMASLLASLASACSSRPRCNAIQLSTIAHSHTRRHCCVSLCGWKSSHWFSILELIR